MQLTLAMNRLGQLAGTSCRWRPGPFAIGIISNTVLKLGAAVVPGRGIFRHGGGPRPSWAWRPHIALAVLVNVAGKTKAGRELLCPPPWPLWPP